MDYLILLSSIALGAVTVLGLKLDDPKLVKLLNAFTGAYLLTLTLLHLLPELYHWPGASANDPAQIGGFMLAGFLMQVALDVISRGIEHGHTHHSSEHLPLGVLLGLCLHAFVEALALGEGHSHHDPSSRRLLLWGIVLHNYPVSIALLGLLLHSGIKRSTALLLLGLFGAMAPLGMLISAHTALAQHTRVLMAIVIGVFLHISTTILLESSDAHRFNVQKLVAIVLGLALGMLTLRLG